MTRRLVQHWPTLYHQLGLNPFDAEHWTLDCALVAEAFADDQAQRARVSAAQRRAGA